LDELARRQYDITATAVMPTDGTAINWGSIEDAKISLMPNVPGAKQLPRLLRNRSRRELHGGQRDGD
jgi:hypothetical protein